MSHKVVYLTIPGFVLKGEFSKELIEEKVASLMRHYVEETADEDDYPTCDGYEIGGRWAGALGALKGTQTVVPAQEGKFAFEFMDTYSVVVHRGQPGPYIAGKKEFVPINGGLAKDIDWTAATDLQNYMEYRIMQLALEKDPMMGNLLHQFSFREDGLYPAQPGADIPVLKKDETFEQWCQRLGKDGQRGILPPDAYTDRQGVWHDENEVWEQWQEDLLRGGRGIPENPQEAAQEQFQEAFHKYLDEELQSDDCLVILDCHTFGFN